jgi:FAD/FMN-containing dehydrogenase
MLKISQNDFEGNLYKNIYDLITNNQEIISGAKPQVSKNSTGYYLWNVWDGQTFDLNKLIVGSQGTLGIITEIKFKLVTPQRFSTNLIVELPSLDKVDRVVNIILKSDPESFECFDDLTIKYALKYLPEVAGELFKAETSPKLVLLSSFTGDSPSECNNKCFKVQNELNSLGVKNKLVSTQDGDKYWRIRRESFNLLRLHSENMRTAPFIDDWVIKPEYLPEFLPKLDEIFKDYTQDLIYTVAGHIGDGNFHIIPLMDLSKENAPQIITELSERVFNLVFEYKGSMAAEHNDGLVRSPYLVKMYGEKVYQLFKQTKEIFDPKNIFNPHKKTDGEFKYSYDHLSHKQIHSHGS